MPQEWEAADGEDTPKKDQLSSYSMEDSFVKERKTSYRKEVKKLPFPVKKKGSFEKIS